MAGCLHTRTGMRRLVQIVALVLFVLAVTTLPAQATPISYAAGNNISGSANFFAIGGEKVQFLLEFNEVLTPGTLDVTITQTAAIPGINCVPIGGPGTCVIFHVVPSAGLTWDPSGYRVDLRWTFNTDPQYPDAPGGLIRMLHDHGSGWVDITLAGSYCTTCPFAINGQDPGVSGRDDNFSDITVSTAVATPEPGSLVLLGSGLTALLVRYRRRRGQTGVGPRTAGV